MRRALFFLLIFCATTSAVLAQVTHYTVKLTPDFDAKILRGEETIAMHREVADAEWQKSAALKISNANSSDGDVAVLDETVKLHRRVPGTHTVYIKYSAAATRGIQWFADKAGFDTAFYCEAWMVCDNSPGQRATLTLEIVLPIASGLSAAGPGELKKQWREKDGDHFLFEQMAPVQTYLFSFGVAKMNRIVDGKFILYAKDAGTDSPSQKDADKAFFVKT